MYEFLDTSSFFLCTVGFRCHLFLFTVYRGKRWQHLSKSENLKMHLFSLITPTTQLTKLTPALTLTLTLTHN